MEEDKVPQEERGKKKKWTSSLMRSLTQMQMGIDCCCPSKLETVCVCVWLFGCGCVRVSAGRDVSLSVIYLTANLTSIFFTCLFMNNQ